MRPQSVKDSDLWHLHVKDETSRNWDLRCVQIENKTSDTALVYARGYMNKNCYLLISFVKNAHSHYGGTDQFLRAMAVIAREFQTKF
jgi:mRNA interferase YafO